MLEFLSSKEILKQNKIITDIIYEMENYFAANQKYVDLDAMKFSYKCINAIDKYPNIFFKCSVRRIVLTKWVVDETENFFRCNKTSVIHLHDLHRFLRKCFKTHRFNRENLQNLFHTKDILEYEAFTSVRDDVLRDYNQYFREGTKSVSLNISKLSNSVDLNKIISQVFPDITFDYNMNNPSYNISDEELTLEEIELKKHLQRVKENLGEELCIYFLKNKDEAQYFYEALSNCANLLKEEERNNKLEQALKKAIKNIDSRLLTARLDPLLSLYKIDNEVGSDLVKLFKDNGIIFVKDLDEMLGTYIESANKSQLIHFAEWLSEDKVVAFKQEFQKIFKSEKEISILKTRAAGGTLERAGRENGVTRERVRQIEIKILKRFDEFLSTKKLYYLLQSYAENDVILMADMLKSKLGEISDIFIYCLKKCSNEKIMWNDKIGGFIIGDGHWCKQLLEYLETMPDVFEASTIGTYISDAKNMLNVEVENSIIEKLVTNNYSLYGKFYTKRKFRKVDIYLAVLERFYPDGIKLFDDFEMMRFRNYVKELFGDIDLPENDRAICARIANMTVLCGRGKYILPDRINIDEETLSRIYQFIIDSPKNVIMFRELFERFKTELLEKTNINNYFFLQGVLKYKYKNEFFFTRGVLIKDINNEQNVKLLIEEFIKEQGRIVTKSEIEEEFFGISNVVLQMAIASNPNILLWDFGSYLHAEQLLIDEATKHRLRRFLDDCMTKGPVSAKEVYNRIYPLENEFLLSNKIYNHIALYSLFRYLFPDDFEFSHPYVSPKGSKVTTFNTLIKEYLSCFDEIYISDLKDYVQTVRGGSFNLSLFLDDISDEFIRVDKNLLVRRNKLDLSERVIENIEETTLALLGDSGFIAVKKMNDYIFYPDIGIKWTPFLLVSIIKYYSKKLKIISSAADYRRINEIIVDSSLNIGDYDGLLRYALRKEIAYGSFKSMEEVREFLRSEGLISNNIPQSLFEKGWLIEDVCGGITIV